jgi:DNA-binding PadR family transcriptional regulator
MSTSKSFDLRELAGELIGLVRDRAKDIASAAVKPDAAKMQNAVLSTITDEPKNAAEITRAISLASAGAWTPTSGEIQQALATLVERKEASSKLDGDRKVYSITKAGLAALANDTKTADPEGVAAESGSAKFANSLNWPACDPKFLSSASKLGPALLDIAQTGTRDQQARAASILENARHELHVILAEK